MRMTDESLIYRGQSYLNTHRKKAEKQWKQKSKSELRPNLQKPVISLALEKHTLFHQSLNGFEMLIIAG